MTDLAMALQRQLAECRGHSFLSPDALAHLVETDVALARWRGRSLRSVGGAPRGPGEFAGVLFQRHRYCPGLAKMLRLPPPAATLDDFEALARTDLPQWLISAEGDLYGTGKYEQIDVGSASSALVAGVQVPTGMPGTNRWSSFSQSSHQLSVTIYRASVLSPRVKYV